MRKTKSKTKGHRKGPSGLALERAHKPPQIQFETRQTRRLRFYNTQANPATSITYYNLLDAVLFAGTATNGYQLYDFVRVISVEMWARRADTGSAVAIGIDYAGLVAGNIGGGRSYNDTSVSTAYPAYLHTRPDPKSQTAQFQPSSASYAFHVRAAGAPAASVIVDVVLEYRNSSVVNPVAVAQAIAGATPGEIYFGTLDGLRNAATVWASELNPNTI